MSMNTTSDEETDGENDDKKDEESVYLSENAQELVVHMITTTLPWLNPVIMNDGKIRTEGGESYIENGPTPKGLFDHFVLGILEIVYLAKLLFEICIHDNLVVLNLIPAHILIDTQIFHSFCIRCCVHGHDQKLVEIVEEIWCCN